MPELPGSVRGKWSIASRDSFLSIGSSGSVLSIGSVGVGVVDRERRIFASLLSIGSSMSALSLLSSMSRLSVLSHQSDSSLLSAQSRRAVRGYRVSGTLGQRSLGR